MSNFFSQILLSSARNPVTAVGLPLTLGMLSYLPAAKSTEGLWYKSLKLPPLQPPSYIYPPAWTTLYVSMGYASHLAAKAIDNSFNHATRTEASWGLALYYASLGLNVAFMPLFFTFKQTGLAFADISALTGLTVYLTKVLHGPTDGKSTYFLAPYCAWLGYATYLSGSAWYLNRNRYIPKTDF